MRYYSTFLIMAPEKIQIAATRGRERRQSNLNSIMIYLYISNIKTSVKISRAFWQGQSLSSPLNSSSHWSFIPALKNSIIALFNSLVNRIGSQDQLSILGVGLGTVSFVTPIGTLVKAVTTKPLRNAFFTVIASEFIEFASRLTTNFVTAIITINPLVTFISKIGNVY